MSKKNKSRKNEPVKQADAKSQVDTEAAKTAETDGSAAEAEEADAAQAAKVEAASKVTAEQDAVKAAAAALKAAREAVKTAKAKVRELGRVPTCTSEALRLAAEFPDASKEDWEAKMAEAGYSGETLNKAAHAMRNQCRVIVKHLRAYGHMPKAE